MELVPDPKESQFFIWPGQLACGGPARTCAACWKAEGRRFDPWLSGSVVWDAVTDELVAGDSHATVRQGMHVEAARQSHTALRQAVSSAALHGLSS